MLSPYTYLPVDVCDPLDLPDFPVNQDCTSYSQLSSEVCGLIIRPYGSFYPIAWYNLSEWTDEGKIDNEDPDAAHYIAGIGSFLPKEKVTVDLASGRVVENRERTQRLVFNVLNTTANHIAFARQLQANKKDFTFNIVTIGGTYSGLTEERVIGGYYGMQPVFVDADFLFNEGAGTREFLQFIIDVEFLDFPDTPLPTP